MKNTIFEKYNFLEGELERMIESYNDKPTKLGELGSQSSSIVNLRNISHQITKLTIDEFEYVILDTPSGQILKQLSDSVIFKPRMIGNLTDEDELCDVDLISIDACHE